MSSSLGLAQPIPCYSQLFDYADDKFVRAVVRDGSGAQISGSPVDLTLVANGLYRNVSLVMPQTAQVSVQYFVYSDSGYTILDQSYAGEVDVFTLQESSGSGGNGYATSNIVGIVDDGGQSCKQTGVQDTLVKGSQRAITLRLVQQAPNGEPYDLTGFTEIQARFLNEDRTTLTLSTQDGSITVISATVGKIAIVITSAQSAVLMPGTPMAFTIVVTKPLGPVAINLPYQLAIVDEAVL